MRLNSLLGTDALPVQRIRDSHAARFRRQFAVSRIVDALLAAYIGKLYRALLHPSGWPFGALGGKSVSVRENSKSLGGPREPDAVPRRAAAVRFWMLPSHLSGREMNSDDEFTIWRCWLAFGQLFEKACPLAREGLRPINDVPVRHCEIFERRA